MARAPGPPTLPGRGAVVGDVPLGDSLEMARGRSLLIYVLTVLPMHVLLNPLSPYACVKQSLLAFVDVVLVALLLMTWNSIRSRALLIQFRVTPLKLPMAVLNGRHADPARLLAYICILAVCLLMELAGPKPMAIPARLVRRLAHACVHGMLWFMALLYMPITALLIRARHYLPLLGWLPFALLAKQNPVVVRPVFLGRPMSH